MLSATYLFVLSTSSIPNFEMAPLTMNWLTVQCVNLELARWQRLKKFGQSILSWHSIAIPHQGRLVQVESGQVLRHRNQYIMIVENSASNNGMDNQQTMAVCSTAWPILLLIFEKKKTISTENVFKSNQIKSIFIYMVLFIQKKYLKVPHRNIQG